MLIKCVIIFPFFTKLNIRFKLCLSTNISKLTLKKFILKFRLRREKKIAEKYSDFFFLFLDVDRIQSNIEVKCYLSYILCVKTTQTIIKNKGRLIILTDVLHFKRIFFNQYFPTRKKFVCFICMNGIIFKSVC